MDENEQRLINSWNNNASSWTRVIRNQQIESRVLVTNSAILETVIELNPKTFLDVGCGEGWLCREFNSKGIEGWGVDASAELIEAAQHEGDTRFLVSLYSDLTSHRFGDTSHFSCLICNFSILGQRDLAYIASAGLCLLEEHGKIIIQTLHPTIACGDAAYVPGWRETAWQGIGDETFHPAPWYFRTIESWIEEFHARNYRLLKLREPCHPATNKLISIIFVFERQ
ncbi:class I SAM-dependent methyltransferase [Coleofasciculus sp. G2-EDA-02]|uniref:class I SAM-dependent methyltransferase n=1 Tax=Coleofasciculus sp. G2-EDA-02 TaxID=3069529 RepID=UPI003300D653